MSASDIPSLWHKLILEAELSNHCLRHYVRHGQQRLRNDLMDYLLPALLYDKAVSILDEALIAHIQLTRSVPPEGYADSLQGRIDLLGQTGALANSSALNAIRQTRDLLANGPKAVIGWTELDQCIDEIERTLQGMGLVGPRPALEFFAERSMAKESTEPGVLFTQDVVFGIKENGVVAIEVKWVEETTRHES